MMKVDEQQLDIKTSTGTTTINVAKKSLFEGRQILVDQSPSYSGTIYTTYQLPAFLPKHISVAYFTEGNVHDIWKDAVIFGNMNGHGAMDNYCKLDFEDVPCIGFNYVGAFGEHNGGSDANLISSIKNFHSLCANNVSSMFMKQESLTQAINLEFDGPGNGNTLNAANMFSGCKNLKKVSIKFNCPANVAGMFNGCNSLVDDDIIIETDYPLIGGNPFSGSNLAGFPKTLRGKKLSTLDNFYKGTAVTEATNEMFEDLLETATSAQYLFYNCKSLTKVNMAFPANITNLNYDFYGCSALDADNINITCAAEKVAARYTFQTCTGLTKSPKCVEDIAFTDLSYAFYGCSNMEEATVNLANITSTSGLYYTFYNCNKLAKITFINVPENLKTSLTATNIKCPTTTEIIIAE